MTNVVGDSGKEIPSTLHKIGDGHVSFTVAGNNASFTVGEEDVEVVAGEIKAQINSSLATLLLRTPLMVLKIS